MAASVYLRLTCPGWCTVKLCPSWRLLWFLVTSHCVCQQSSLVISSSVTRTHVISTAVHQQLTYAFFLLRCSAPRRVVAGNVLSWWIEDTQVLSEDLSPKQFHWFNTQQVTNKNNLQKYFNNFYVRQSFYLCIWHKHKSTCSYSIFVIQQNILSV